jgi:hypothetical protein
MAAALEKQPYPRPLWFAQPTWRAFERETVYLLHALELFHGANSPPAPGGSGGAASPTFCFKNQIFLSTAMIRSATPLEVSSEAHTVHAARTKWAP